MECFIFVIIVTKEKKNSKTKRKSKKTQKIKKTSKTHLIFIELVCGSGQSSGMTQLSCCRDLHCQAGSCCRVLRGGSGSSSQVRRSIDIRLWHTFLDQFNIQVQVFFFVYFFQITQPTRNI